MVESTENHSESWYEVGSAKYPSKRDGTVLPTAFDWLDVKQDADSLEIDPQHPYLWRIHDDLYDFTNFKSHPGGYSFIEFSKNTDITEMFESSHVDIDKARAYLSKYFVKKAKTPRNSKSLTFHSDGFYCTLRTRVCNYLKAKQVATKSNWPYSKPYLQSTKFVHDVLLSIFIALMVAASSYEEQTTSSAYFSSTNLLLFTAGFILSLLMMCAHNFFHLRNNWRMYSFDISMFSSHEWRISHGYSHHGFPNTMLDYEIAVFEPILRFLPFADKQNPLRIVGTFLFITVMMPLAMHTSFLKRLARGSILPIINPEKVSTAGLRWENFLPVFVTLASALVFVHASLIQKDEMFVSVEHGVSKLLMLLPHALYVAALRCSIMYISCSTCFLYLSLAGTHHHPNVWHAGDPATIRSDVAMPAKDDIHRKNNKIGDKTTKAAAVDRATVLAAGMDWGTLQLLATGRRPSMDQHLWTAAVIFGQHALHHLFPTVDLAVLYELEPIFRQTCGEFGLEKLIDNSKSRYEDRRSLTDLQCFSGTLYQAFWGNTGHEENFYPEIWNYYRKPSPSTSQPRKD